MKSLIALLASAFLAGPVGACESISRTGSGESLSVIPEGATHLDFETNTVWQAVLADTQKQGLSVLGIQPIHELGQAVRWAVVTARSIEPPGKPFKEISNITLQVYVKSGMRFRCTSRLGPLDDPRFADWPANSVELQCLDLNHAGTEEVLLSQDRVGASWQPGCVFVFKPGTKRLTLAGTLTSDYRIEVKQFGGSEQYQVLSTYAIGEKLAHVQQPRWTDYYGFNGTEIVLVNDRLPGQFREWPDLLQAALRHYPDDPELWFYLGNSCRILGREPEAKAAFAKAKALGYRAAAPRARRLRTGVKPIPSPHAAPSHR